MLDMNKKFHWKRLPSSKTGIHNLLRGLEDMLEHGICPFKRCCVLDVACGPSRKPTWSAEFCPCLTRSRSGGGGYWVTCLARELNLVEKLRLQGTYDMLNVASPLLKTSANESQDICGFHLTRNFIGSGIEF